VLGETSHPLNDRSTGDRAPEYGERSRRYKSDDTPEKACDQGFPVDHAILHSYVIKDIITIFAAGAGMKVKPTDNRNKLVAVLFGD
jgi:hypothetical protein